MAEGRWIASRPYCAFLPASNLFLSFRLCIESVRFRGDAAPELSPVGAFLHFSFRCPHAVMVTSFGTDCFDVHFIAEPFQGSQEVLLVWVWFNFLSVSQAAVVALLPQT